MLHDLRLRLMEPRFAPPASASRFQQPLPTPGFAVPYLAGTFLVLTPVAAINTAVSNPRELMGTTWQLGPNFYIGNGPEATGTYMAPRFVRDDKLVVTIYLRSPLT